MPQREHHYGADKVCPPVPKPTPTNDTSTGANQSPARAVAHEKVRAAINGYPIQP